jgi:MFS family permease
VIPGTPPISGPELERLEGVSAEELAAVKLDDGPAVETEGTGSLEVLKNRPFLALWLAQASTQIGGNMVLYGLTVQVYSLTNSTSAVSLLILTFLVPSVLLSAVAGVYVDRLDRRLILIVTNLLRAVMFGLLYFIGNSLIVILILNVGVSTVTTFFAPAEASMIPVLVKRNQLLAANGIFTLTLNAAFALGFALLGPLVVNLTSPQALLLVVAAFYLLAMGLTITLPSAPPTPEDHGHGLAAHEAGAAAASTLGQLREGIAFIRANRSITWSLIYLGITASLIGVLGVVGPAFANQALGLSPKDFVVIVLPLGIGVVTGILFLNSYGKLFSRRRTIETGLILLGIFLALMTAAGPITRFLQHVSSVSPIDVSALVTLLSVVIVLAFLAGIAYANVAIPAQTQLQEDLPQEVRGRVFGVLNMLISTASFLPIIIVGPIADLASTTAVVLVVAIAITISGILSAVLRRPPAPAPT